MAALLITMKKLIWIAIITILVTTSLFAISYRGRLLTLATELIAKQKLPPATKLVDTTKKLEKPNSITPSNTLAPHLSSPQGGEGKGEGAMPKTQNIEVLPKEFNLAVPFTSQAPFALWDAAHEDACEEAALMMVDAFYKNRKFTPQSAENEITSIIEWEKKILGHWEDTTAEETARILREKHGYDDVQIIYNITIEDIKREVAKGHPVILPAAGQLLGNKYFYQPGPLYHMLVVRGWTKDGLIITNDPGTKRGEGYLYKPDILLNAIHDWNDGDVPNGKKVMIVVEK